MMGSDINRNTVIEEKVARETFRAWLMPQVFTFFHLALPLLLEGHLQVGRH